MWIIAPLFCGLIFGRRVCSSPGWCSDQGPAFLDIFGAWDPTLAVVMAAALAVAIPGFRLADRGARPWFAGEYSGRANREIDLPLVAGAALFGIGWGVVGLCPGPALESLATLSPGIIVFVVAMAAGMLLHNAWQQSRLTAQRDRQLASATDG